MGNVGGGEILVILLVALIVLGPTKLPTAIRQVGRFIGEVRRIGTGFQQELREATEPLREPLKETKATLQAADKELREVAKPLKETAAAIKAADPRKAAASEPKGASNSGESKDQGADANAAADDGTDDDANAAADDGTDDDAKAAGDAGDDDSGDGGSGPDGAT